MVRVAGPEKARDEASLMEEQQRIKTTIGYLTLAKVSSRR
jgi:hypothetical protein